MPKPSDRTTKRRRTFKRLPGGKTVKRVKGKMKGKARCGKCGAELHGIPRDTRKLSKSEKTVNRPYGGHYCSRCLREKIKEKIKSLGERLAQVAQESQHPPTS